MAISFVATATAVNSTITTTSLACNVPAGTANNDVMVAVISRPSSSATVSTPSGWTVVPGFPVQNTNGTTMAGFYRVAASEPASYTWSGSAGKWCIATMSYRGASTSTPINTSSAAVDTTSRAAHTSPSITTTVASCWLIAAYADRGTSSADTWSTPTGHTSRSGNLSVTGTNNNSLATFDTNAGQTTGSYSYSSTASASQSNACMATIALAPAGSSPTPVAATATAAAGGSIRRAATLPRGITVTAGAVAARLTTLTALAATLLGVATIRRTAMFTAVAQTGTSRTVLRQASLGMRASPATTPGVQRTTSLLRQTTIALTAAGTWGRLLFVTLQAAAAAAGTALRTGRLTRGATTAGGGTITRAAMLSRAAALTNAAGLARTASLPRTATAGATGTTRRSVTLARGTSLTAAPTARPGVGGGPGGGCHGRGCGTTDDRLVPVRNGHHHRRCRPGCEPPAGRDTSHEHGRRARAARHTNPGRRRHHVRHT